MTAEKHPAWIRALVKSERRKARVAERGRMLKAHEAAERAWRASHAAEVEGLNRAINALTTQRNEAQHRAENQNKDALTEAAGAVRALNDANLGNARLRESAEAWKQRALTAEGALAERHKRFPDARETVVDVENMEATHGDPGRAGVGCPLPETPAAPPRDPHPCKGCVSFLAYGDAEFCAECLKAEAARVNSAFPPLDDQGDSDVHCFNCGARGNNPCTCPDVANGAP